MNSFKPSVRMFDRAQEAQLLLSATTGFTPEVQVPVGPAIADETGRVRNVIDQATANFIASVNAACVTVEEMSLAAAEIQKLPLDHGISGARGRKNRPEFNPQRRFTQSGLLDITDPKPPFAGDHRQRVLSQDPRGKAIESRSLLIEDPYQHGSAQGDEAAAKDIG
jgi:hypothetical protein